MSIDFTCEETTTEDTSAMEDVTTETDRSSDSIYSLPQSVHLPSRNLGYNCILVSISSFVIGIFGLVDSNHKYNPAMAIAVNVWGAILYIPSGYYSIISQKNQTKPHLLHCFYFFSLITLITSSIQLGINLSSNLNLKNSEVRESTLWFNVVSAIIGVIQFITGSCFIYMLTKHVYGPAAIKAKLPSLYFSLQLVCTEFGMYVYSSVRATEQHQFGGGTPLLVGEKEKWRFCAAKI
ncbi:hypothetical protein TrispH2_004386 [Trichoplax sp. H2]|nr:hypothetical protein TrispH2_004386 [Trichoplax sp. H2]|eukprot:RDD44537.1 hypothetical protein TrispH2_004386 [Trichoplax sp. H2]